MDFPASVSSKNRALLPLGLSKQDSKPSTVAETLTWSTYGHRSGWYTLWRRSAHRVPGLLRKEVIQPQVPLRLPCYDFTPVIGHTVVSVLLAVRLPTSGATNSHGVTGGVYKARERIHRGILIRDY